MAASFFRTLPTLKDHARLLLADRKGADPATGAMPENMAILSDEEYLAVLGAYDYSTAVGLLADSILGQVAQQPDRIRAMTGSSYEWNKRLDGWKDLSARGAAGKLPEPGVAPSAQGGPATQTVQLGTVRA